MRIVDIIMSELNSDKLKLEDDIERVLNDKSLNAELKVATIKSLLSKVVSLEMSFIKFKTYTEAPTEQAGGTQQGAESNDPNNNN